MNILLTNDEFEFYVRFYNIIHSFYNQVKKTRDQISSLSYEYH